MHCRNRLQGLRRRRHSVHMKALVLMLATAACAVSQVNLTPQDEAGIRTAIRERAKADNMKGTGRVWSELGPLVYKIGEIEAIAADVATAEASGVRPGAYTGRREYLFLLTRSNGQWTIARRVQVCTGLGPMRIVPAEGEPK